MRDRLGALAFWRHVSPKWRRRATRLLLLAVAILVGWSTYLALRQPAREADDIRRALHAENEQLRVDNRTLCDFFRAVDTTLGSAFTHAPNTPAGQGFRAAFGGLQLAARKVTVSPICEPPKPPPARRAGVH